MGVERFFPALSLSCCVNFGQSLSLSQPHFPHLQRSAYDTDLPLGVWRTQVNVCKVLRIGIAREPGGHSKTVTESLSLQAAAGSLCQTFHSFQCLFFVLLLHLHSLWLLLVAWHQQPSKEESDRPPVCWGTTVPPITHKSQACRCGALREWGALLSSGPLALFQSRTLHPRARCPAYSLGREAFHLCA